MFGPGQRVFRKTIHGKLEAIGIYPGELTDPKQPHEQLAKRRAVGGSSDRMIEALPTLLRNGSGTQSEGSYRSGWENPGSHRVHRPSLLFRQPWKNFPNLVILSDTRLPAQV